MEEKTDCSRIFSKNVRRLLEEEKADPSAAEEIRMRVGQPLFYIRNNCEYRIGGEDFRVSEEDVEETLQCAVRYSLYAYEEEIRQGFLTVRGGHRIGIAGQAVPGETGIRTISPVTCLNIRFSHEIRGCADAVLPYLVNPLQNRIYSTLIISPPRCGKTTLLRDMIRQISDGTAGITGKNVGLADERSEIAACFRGVPQNDVGCRTDVLDCCPKALGLQMLIRSMAPEVVAADEVGSREDMEALRLASCCGCRILATVHGESPEDVRIRSQADGWQAGSCFERFLILGNRKGPGTVVGLQDSSGKEMLCG